MKIAYIVDGEILAPVVASQTFPLLRKLRELGHQPHLVVITSPRRWFAPSRWAGPLRAAREVVGGEFSVLTHLPRHTFLPLLAKRLARVLARISPDVVHARQSRAAMVASMAGRYPLLLDMRGIRPEEMLLSLGLSEEELDVGQRRTLSRLREFDRRALAAANATVCVSNPFREHLGEVEGVHVIPNAAESPLVPTDRERLDRRAALGLLPEERVWVYSGSLAKWQCAEEALRLYREIARQSPRERLALLTHDLVAGVSLVEAMGITNAIVQSLRPEETRACLPLFDLALLLRRPSPVNRVACPVKYAEYLHGGLPVIQTDEIGDTGRWTKENELGVVLSRLDAPDNAKRVMAALGGLSADRCRAFARDRLTFDATAPAYVKAYDDAVRNSAPA